MKSGNPTLTETGPGAQWAWHSRFLKALQRKLGGQVEARRQEALRPLESQSVDKADTATDEFDHEVARALLAVEGNLRVEVGDALKRIQDGTYGICERTGRPIPPERLRAVPWTRYCKEVQAGSGPAAGPPGGRTSHRVD